MAQSRNGNASHISADKRHSRDHACFDQPTQNINATLTEEQSSLYEYVLNPIPAVRDEHQAAVVTLSSLAQALLKDSDPINDAFGRQVSAQQAGQIVYSAQFFSAIDAHDLTLANIIRSRDIDPSFEHIGPVFDKQTRIEAAKATASLAQLEDIQRVSFVMGSLILVTGLLLIVASMWANSSSQRNQNEATRAELARFERMALADLLTDLGNHYAFYEHNNRTGYFKSPLNRQITFAKQTLSRNWLINPQNH